MKKQSIRKFTISYLFSGQTMVNLPYVKNNVLKEVNFQDVCAPIT